MFFIKTYFFKQKNKNLIRKDIYRYEHVKKEIFINIRIYKRY